LTHFAANVQQKNENTKRKEKNRMLPRILVSDEAVLELLAADVVAYCDFSMMTCWGEFRIRVGYF